MSDIEPAGRAPIPDQATPDQPEAAPVAPVAPVSATKGASRIESLDFIRGIAVLGILAANIVAFGQPGTAYLWPDAFMVPHGETSDWLWVGQFVVIDGKMRGLFTILFGAGMFLFLEKAWARGAGTWLQARRLLWLLLFGLIHFYFIWKGDILAGYAMCGLLALIFVKMKPTNQMILGLVGYIVGALMWALVFGGMYAFTQMDAKGDPAMIEAQAGMGAMEQDMMADDAIEVPLIQGGDYGGLVAHQMSTHLFDPLVGMILLVFETLPLILIGMALFRFGLFDGRMNPRKMMMWGVIGVIAGSALNLLVALWAHGQGLTFMGTYFALFGLASFGNLPVILGLAALLVLAAPKAVGFLGTRLKAAGRAAFTNYLGTSIVMLFVFHGWAFGLFGKLSRPELYLVVLAAWVVMLLWSKPWLDRFRYGPLEWLWRCLTYGRVFPLKR